MHGSIDTKMFNSTLYESSSPPKKLNERYLTNHKNSLVNINNSAVMNSGDSFDEQL